MTRRVTALALLFAGGVAHGMSWADFWSRPEQQTLAQRQQAYSEIQGQQYAAAAEHLKTFADPVSQYNRGNALAHMGDLKSAISAYDSVLHGYTADASLQRDAQHNRDLIEQQMKSQPQSEKSGQKSGKNPQDGKGSEDGKGGKDNKNSGAGQDQGKGDQNDKAQGDKKQSDNAQEKPDQSANGASGQSAGQPQSTEPSEQQTAQRAPEPKNPAAPDKATSADARPGVDSPPAQAEQAQSLDQWLRWIPDDPTGLLRRKFMIEHMQHQSEAQQ
jgi:Ca-activated chloride channel family protein